MVGVNHAGFSDVGQGEHAVEGQISGLDKLALEIEQRVGSGSPGGNIFQRGRSLDVAFHHVYRGYGVVTFQFFDIFAGFFYIAFRQEAIN